jgi:taurine dioxygenase
MTSAISKAFSLTPLSVGAEVVGLKLEFPMNEDTKRQLYAAWLDYGILIFRNVGSIDAHIALSQVFGELEIHPFPEARARENPLFIEIGGEKQLPAFVFDESDLRVNRIPWHRDTAYTPGICKGAVLRMLEVPPVHGETLFADTAIAYDELPEDVKHRLAGLEYKASLRLGIINQTRPGALWRTARAATAEEDPRGVRRQLYDNEAEARYPPVIQPAVLIHPESDRRCIFLSPTYVDYFLGMEQAESDALLRFLVEHTTQPRYVYKHKWCVDDAILWDNRRFMHAAVGNRVEDRRRGLRTTLAGALNTGRYFEDTAATPGAPALVD